MHRIAAGGVDCANVGANREQRRHGSGLRVRASLEQRRAPVGGAYLEWRLVLDQRGERRHVASGCGAVERSAATLIFAVDGEPVERGEQFGRRAAGLGQLHDPAAPRERRVRVRDHDHLIRHDARVDHPAEGEKGCILPADGAHAAAWQGHLA